MPPRFASYEPEDEPIPGYRLVRFLAGGPAGEVWTAADTGTGRMVALKVVDLDAGPAAAKEFRSLKLVRHLNHPNLVPILAARVVRADGADVPLDDPTAAAGGRLVIVMGLGERSLAAALDALNPPGTPPDRLRGLPADELLGYMEGAARGIDYLNRPDHGLGADDGPLVHCGVCPADLLVVSGEVQVADAGAATRATGDARQTRTSNRPAYSPPELSANRPGPGTDQYSLAVTYYELRTGRLPFPDDLSAVQVMMVHADGRLDFSSPVLSDGERRVLRWATARQPGDRYPSCGDFVRQLRRAVSGQEPAAPGELTPAPRPSPVPPPPAAPPHLPDDPRATLVLPAQPVPPAAVSEADVLPDFLPPTNPSLPSLAPPAAPSPRSTAALPDLGIPSRADFPAPAGTRAELDLDGEPDLDADADEDEVPARARRRAAPAVERRATVRYYERMHPQRTYPLLVVLSPAEVQAVVRKYVKQAAGGGFRAAADEPVEVEPVLPGCDCYPPREAVRLSAGDAPQTLTFWVVPHVLGTVQGARVVVRQGGRVLAEVPLAVKVRTAALAWALGAAGLVAPYGTAALRHARLDWESQKADGFPVYQAVGDFLLTALRPEVLGLVLFALAGAAYLWLRPRRRDVFWDVVAAPPPSA
jgi:serine/threonine protein kinase